MHDKYKVRASLIELYKRDTKVVKGQGENIYFNGSDNLYPNEVERIINSSPTAFRCAKLMAKYIGGKGISNGSGGVMKYAELPIINKAKNYRITDIISHASRSISYQYGVFFHVTYGLGEDGKFIPIALDVLDYTKCRISKEDTEENAGKIYYDNYEKTKKRFKKSEDEEEYWYYPYNTNQAIIQAQIKADSKDEDDLTLALSKYRGQVFYLNLNPEYAYALSPVDSVYNDADTEYRVSLYNNKQSRSGFLGKTAIITNGLDEEKEKQVKEDIASFLGAEGSDNVWHLNVEGADSLENVLRVEQVNAQFDDKLFSETKTTIRENIMGAFNNIPEPLVMSSKGSLFGTNSDTYREMKLFYSEQTEEEREKLQETLHYLGFPVTIEPIISQNDGVQQSTVN